MILARNVLFYPYIDIDKSKWLQTALLTWENISTIVPADYDEPYQHPQTQILQDAGILEPRIISSYEYVTTQTAHRLFGYLKSREGVYFTRSNTIRFNKKNNENKFIIYTAKMHEEVINLAMKKFGAERIDGTALLVPESFSKLYMTLLASTIAKHDGTSIWGETRQYRRMSNEYLSDEDRVRSRGNRDKQTALANFALRSIRINPHTSIKDIIKFRERYTDERRRFREEINSLSEILQDEYPSQRAFQSACETIYNDRIDGAIQDLRSALDSYKIPHSITIVSMLALANSVPWFATGNHTTALLSTALGVGIAAGVQYMNYKGENYRNMQENPFSYVLIGEKELGKNVFKKRI